MLISNCCNLITNKIDVSQLTTSNYISTENLLPNFGGITIATNLPKGKVTKFEKENILMSNIRPYFKKFYYSSISGGCSSDVLVLNVNKSIAIPKYIYYLLCSDKFVNMYVANCKGTKMPRGNKEVLLNYQFELPSYEVQQHIVDTIGSIDDLIESIKCKIDKLNEILMNLFDKLPLVNGNKFYDIFTTMNGGTFSSKDYLKHSNEKLITIKNINSEGFDSSSPTYFKYNEKYEKYRLNIGDILLTMTGAYLGRSGIVDDENCFLNQRVLKVSSVSNAFTYCFLQKNKDNIFNLGKGSAQQNLGLKELACFDVNYSTETIKEFTNYDLFIDNIVKYKITIRKLNNIKQIYLKKFFG